MNQDLFLSILNEVTAYDEYFSPKIDAVGQPGLQPIQKVTSAIQMLTYGGSADANNEYSQLSVYPTFDDLKRLLAIGEAQGFPCMLESLARMHWEWKNCPASWARHFSGKKKVCQF